MSKYEERVKQRAYEFARDKYKQSFYQVQGGPPMPYPKLNEDDPFVKKAIASISENYILAAQLSIQREAEQWKGGFAFGYDAGQEYAEPDTEKQLIEIGLIPPKTETTCTGECYSGIPSHTCPYKADIYGDNSLCACCDKCTSACSDNR